MGTVNAGAELDTIVHNATYSANVNIESRFIIFVAVSTYALLRRRLEIYVIYAYCEEIYCKIYLYVNKILDFLSFINELHLLIYGTKSCS